MPCVTQLPDSFLTVDADLGAVDTGDTRVLNATNPSEEFTLYDPPGNSATIVERGDSLRLNNASPSVSALTLDPGRSRLRHWALICRPWQNCPFS